MRRGKISFRSIFAIILASIFTLISFFFDQQVIQTENKARDLNSDIVIKEKKYEDFYSGYESMLYFIDIYLCFLAVGVQNKIWISFKCHKR